jgi:hypothetical protein
MALLDVKVGKEVLEFFMASRCNGMPMLLAARACSGGKPHIWSPDGTMAALLGVVFPLEGIVLELDPIRGTLAREVVWQQQEPPQQARSVR